MTRNMAYQPRKIWLEFKYIFILQVRHHVRNICPSATVHTNFDVINKECTITEMRSISHWRYNWTFVFFECIFVQSSNFVIIPETCAHQIQEPILTFYNECIIVYFGCLVFNATLLTHYFSHISEASYLTHFLVFLTSTRQLLNSNLQLLHLKQRWTTKIAPKSRTCPGSNQPSLVYKLVALPSRACVPMVAGWSPDRSVSLWRLSYTDLYFNWDSCRLITRGWCIPVGNPGNASGPIAAKWRKQC